MIRLVIFCLVLLVESVSGIGPRSTVDLGFLGHSEGDLNDMSLSRMAPGLNIAYEKILNGTGILSNMTLRIHPADTKNSRKLGLDQVVNFTYQFDLDAVIGPASPNVAKIVGLFTSQRNIATVGYSLADAALSDETVYDTFVTTHPRTDSSAPAFAGLLEHLGWSSACQVLPSSRPEFWLAIFARVRDIAMPSGVRWHPLRRPYTFTRKAPPDVPESDFSRAFRNVRRRCRGRTRPDTCTRVLHSIQDRAREVLSCCSKICLNFLRCCKNHGKGVF